MSKSNIVIKRADVELIISFLRNARLLNRMHALLTGDDKSKSCLVTLSNEELELLLDELTYYLTLKGVDQKGEVNDLGRRIEDVIDQLLAE